MDWVVMRAEGMTDNEKAEIIETVKELLLKDNDKRKVYFGHSMNQININCDDYFTEVETD